MGTESSVWLAIEGGSGNLEQAITIIKIRNDIIYGILCSKTSSLKDYIQVVTLKGATNSKCLYENALLSDSRCKIKIARRGQMKGRSKWQRCL
ncbi:MAG: hypothetical protein JW915_16235 [Chitinispirillaceae bacterium]|nr:hypothetical protein [Chitinispirillaceae bacterium]